MPFFVERKLYVFPVAVFGQMDFHDSTFEGDSMIRVPEKVRIERRVGELPLQI